MGPDDDRIEDRLDLLPIWVGRLGDLAGHRRVLLTGLAAFGVASLAAGLSPTSLALIASRFFQAASAAFVAPQALAIITDLFPEGPARARALGIFQGATAAGASAGIVLGGVLRSTVRPPWCRCRCSPIPAVGRH